MPATATAALAASLIVLLPHTASARALDIFFIDVEGGQATLLVTPAGESVLVDAGYTGRGGRDADRILAAVREAGISRIDYLVITHFHNDHVGGVPDLADRIPIGTFVDYGAPLGTPLGADRLSARPFASYEPARAAGRHLAVRAGERLPLQGIDATIVSAGGELVDAAPLGTDADNAACRDIEDQPPDGTENYRSVGMLVRFGAFSFVNLGDLSGNTLADMVCPSNRVGEASVYLIAHHGNYDSSVPAVYAALRPRVAIMNNGPRKGGHPAAFDAARTYAALEDLWQLHAARSPAVNAADDFIANVDGDGSDGYWLRLTANDDGSFTIGNARNGVTRHYAAR